MKLKPLHDWAVIRPSEAAEVTAGGLFIPDTAKDKPQEGVVEAIGPGAYEEEKKPKKKDEKKERRFVPTIVKTGDRVLYERYAGQTYKIDGEERILVRERDILGVLSDTQPSGRKPLQIPASTTMPGSTALIKPAVEPAVKRPQLKKKRKKPTKKTIMKTAPKKKAAKRGMKKQTVKAKKTATTLVRKSKSKKTSAKKAGKKK
ncbi:MAG: GroES family chaperonin [Betaproteobacteria bacterium]